MNVLFNKVFFQLQIIYNNFVKFSKTLKKIKAYFTCVNTRHKITRKIRKKEKTQKIDKAIHSRTLKRFASFLSRLIYTLQLLISFCCIIDY